MASNSKLGRGKRLNKQSQEIVRKIYKYFEEAIDTESNSPVSAAQLVTHSTGITKYALKRALAQHKTKNMAKYKTTKWKRKKRNILSNDTNAQAIRRTIHGLYTKQDGFPTLQDLLLILKDDINYQDASWALKEQVSKLGFECFEKGDDTIILLEGQDVRYRRLQYLTKIEEYRAQGRNIVYTGEMCIESSQILSTRKVGIPLTHAAKPNLVIFLAGDSQNVLQETMYMFDGNKIEVKEEIEKTKDNFEHYEKWYKLYVIPYLKPASIIVVNGDTPFYKRIQNWTPHANSSKREIMDWLTSRNIPYSIGMYKPQLYQLVLLNKDKQREYKIDALLREHGHTVLRIPAHYADLNPVRNMLSVVKEYVGSSVFLSIESAQKIAKEKISSIEADEWLMSLKMAEAEENSLKSMDMIIDEISEKTGGMLNCSDDDEDDASDLESSDSD